MIGDGRQAHNCKLTQTRGLDRSQMHPENLDLSPLAKSRSHAVALIVSDITNPFFAEIIPAIEERLGTDGFVVFVGNSAEDRRREERLLAKFRQFPPDGILICPALGDVESSLGSPALAGRLPIVAFARRASGLDYAGVDNAQGAQLAVEHFYLAVRSLSCGERRCMGAPERNFF